MIKKFEEFINESATNVPLDAILDGQGKILATRPTLSKEEEYVNYPRYEFTFKSSKNLKDFENTTFNREFWLAIYDYDNVIDNKNDYTHIDAKMKQFGNVIVNKKLYIWATNPSDIDELHARCKNAEAEYSQYLKSVKFIPVL